MVTESTQLALLLGALAWLIVGAGLWGGWRFGYAALLLGSFTVTWNGVRIGSGITLSDLLLVIAVALGLISRANRLVIREIPREHRLLLLFAALLALGGGIAAAISGDVGAIPLNLKFTLSVLGSVFAVQLHVVQWTDWQKVAGVFAAGAAISAIVALVSDDRVAGRALGLANHPNHFALATLLGLTLVLAVAVTVRRMALRVLFVAMGCILVAGLLSSGARAALLALVVGGAALLALLRSRAIPVVWAGIVAAMLIAVSVGQSIVESPAARRVLQPTKYEYLSNDGRRALLDEGLQALRDNPVLGQGFGESLVYHNLPLQLAVVGGLFGVAALLVLVGLGTLVVRAAQAGSAITPLKVCAAGLVGLSTFLLVSPNLYDRFVLLFLALVASMNVFARSRESDWPDSQAEGRAGRGRAPVGSVTARRRSA